MAAGEAENPRREFWESPDKSKIMSGEDVKFIIVVINIIIVIK